MTDNFRKVSFISLVAILVISGFFVNIQKIFAASSASWYDNNWSYRKKITIDHTKVPNTDQSYFPVLISITDTDLKNHALSTGYDILFTDDTSNQIPYEREQYISTTGTLVAWVRVPTLSSSDDTVIYMYYGSPGASDQQDTTGGTWDANFRGVWHSNDASSTTIADSTANANTGTKYGTTGPVEINGKIGKAQSYDGIDSYIGIVPPDTLSGSFTVSAWAKVPDDANTYTFIGTRGPMPGDKSFDVKFDNGSYIIHGDIGDGTDWITTEADTTSFTYAFDTWYQITYAVTPTGYTIYIDGDDVADGSYPASVPLLFDSDHNFFIGQLGYDDEWFNGVIDEVRISDVVRSADWIKTEYNNENNPSTFYGLGSEEPIPVYTLTYTAGANGSIVGTSLQTVNYGSDGTTVTATPNTGYHFVNWSDGVLTASRTDTSVTADISVTANFAADAPAGGGGGIPVVSYIITASAGANGSISPNGLTYLDSGTSQTYTITPAAGYQVADVLVDGISVGALTTYTFSNVTASHTISATFSAITPTCKFSDINCDGPIDKYDFALMMSQWGQTGTGLSADLNQDGVVNKYDFALLMLNWGL